MVGVRLRLDRHPRSRRWPPRPEQGFGITSLQSRLTIEATHRKAGFTPIADEVVRRRFWQFLSFLQRDGYLVRFIVATIEDLKPTTELRNSHLTDLGYSFVQRYGDRWMGRMFKDQRPDKEEGCLKRWHQPFLSEARDA